MMQFLMTLLKYLFCLFKKKKFSYLKGSDAKEEGKNTKKDFLLCWSLPKWPQSHGKTVSRQEPRTAFIFPCDVNRPVPISGNWPTGRKAKTWTSNQVWDAGTARLTCCNVVNAPHLISFNREDFESINSMHFP